MLGIKYDQRAEPDVIKKLANFGKEEPDEMKYAMMTLIKFFDDLGANEAYQKLFSEFDLNNDKMLSR